MRLFRLRPRASTLLLALIGTGFTVSAQQRPVAAADKLAPPFTDPAARRATWSACRVLATDAASLRQWLQAQLPHVRLAAAGPDPRVLSLSGLLPGDLHQLARCAAVQFIDVPNRQAYPERELDGNDLAANRVTVVHSLYPNLTGQGITASVKEEVFDPTDIDFQGRVVSSPLFTSLVPSDHATTMATLIGGAGNSAPTGRGAARLVRLATSSFANLMPDANAQLAADNVSVQNHSYGSGRLENYYGLEARAYDEQTRQFPSLLHVFSAGNYGNQTPTTGTYAGLANTANLTGQFKLSKNTLAVGATDALGRVSPLSSRGPAHDGRLKPELVALGEAGTSDAAAVVSGIAVLTQQAYRDQYSSLPSSALVKAALLTAADDVGRPGPDYESGYGQADAVGAVEVLLNNRFLTDAVGAGAVRSFPITVPAGQRQVKITLAWNDPEAAGNAALALVNDLDVELVGPGGQRWRPWILSAAPNLDSLALPARRGLDRRNNVEQITLAAPAAGTYQIQVRGHQLAVGATQAFAVAYEWEAEGLSWNNPTSGTTWRSDRPMRLRWQWRGPAATAQLEYRTAGTTTWQVVNPAVDLTSGIIQWTPPAAAQVAQLRFVRGTAVYPSAEFALSPVPVMSVGFACEDQALLTWTRVPGASQYRVLQLSGTSLVPLTLVPDTALVLSGPQLTTRYYAVEPVLPGGAAGYRSRTIDYTTSGTACYIRSFLPRQLVTDQVLFDLEVGATTGLRAVHLEREENGAFVSAQTITPGANPRMVLADEPPASGLYRYRARLETVAGRSYFTQVEEVYFVRAGEVMVFPNPVAGGQPLTLVEAEGKAVRWQLYDHLGRLLRESQEDGTVNRIDTGGLRAGAYILRLYPADGPALRRRIIVL